MYYVIMIIIIRFTWEDSGQVKNGDGRCVTVRQSDKVLILETCRDTSDNSQLFSYRKSDRSVSMSAAAVV